MAELPFLPLATDAWIGDTAHLSRIERGLYMDLLILMWRTPECRVPNDMGWICRKLRCDETEREMLAELIAEFCISTGNWLSQKRLRKEWDRARENSKKQSDRAKGRWNKGKEECRGNAYTHESGNAPTPTPTPTVKREANASPKARGSRLPDDWQPDDDKFPDTLADRIRELIPEADRAAWVSDQVASFRDYWAARAGAGACKLDWDKTLHTWLRKELNDVRRRNWARADATQARVISLHGPRR